MLAKAVAAESGANFLSITAANIRDKYVGTCPRTSCRSAHPCSNRFRRSLAPVSPFAGEGEKNAKVNADAGRGSGLIGQGVGCVGEFRAGFWPRPRREPVLTYDPRLCRNRASSRWRES